MMIKICFNLLNLIFLTVSIYYAVDAGYDVLKVQTSDLLPANKIQGSIVEPPNNNPHPFSYYQPIITRNLFHSNRSDHQGKAVKDVELEKLNKTKLQLKLWGTVVSPAERSYAVIESDAERKQNLYRVGDTVSDAFVKRILREKVVLTVDGVDEVLEIEQPAQETTGSTFSPMAVIAQPTEFSSALSKRRITMSRSQIEAATGNLSQLLNEAKIEPAPDGLLVSNVKPNSLFRRMGLRNGDVIVGVDGKPIGSVDDALKLYENLKTSDTASVEIKRRNRSQVIEYRIR